MPTDTIGRYEVESVIGRGAMAVVYRATDPTIGRHLALKTMRFDVHGIEKNEVLSRFRNEARAAGKLLHPNLVTIYDAGEQDGTFYIAMECVEGHTLQALLAEERFLTLDRTVDIMAQICSGLDYAHANGVVHRDIKPANVMLTRSGVVKIMDFGIAKSGAQLTTGGDILGTPNYISPEMVKGDPVDGRSDLFSVAVMLHEMLLGERPFTAPNISTIIYKIVNEAPSPELETKVHPALAAILRKALSKHPSDRYQSGADLVGALKSYQALLTQEIPDTVIPGTPILTNWPVVQSAAAPAPALANTTPIAAFPQAPAGEPPYAAPEIFGADIPEVFRAPVAEPDATPPMFGAIPPPLPKPTVPPPPPASAVSSSFGPVLVAKSPIGAKTPAAPPPIYGAHNLQPERPIAKPGNFKRVLIVGGITAVLMLGVLFATRSKPQPETGPAAQPALTVIAPDSPVVTQTESARGPEESSKIDLATERAVSNSDAVVVRKKNAKPEAKVPAVVASASAPAATAPTTADLAISTAPSGASVQLDGQNRSEKTPFTAAGLKPGTHTLIFTKQGYSPVTKTVEVVAGNDATLNVGLAVAPTGVAFESTPSGAEIFVDDEPTGRATPATVNLTPGAHAISIFKPGFDEGTGNVNLSEGEVQHFAVVLQPGDRDSRARRLFAGARDKGMIIVRSRPRGASIKLDDISVAATPARVIVRNGKAHLVVEKPGYKTFQRDVQVGKGDVIVVDAILDPK